VVFAISLPKTVKFSKTIQMLLISLVLDTREGVEFPGLSTSELHNLCGILTPGFCKMFLYLTRTDIHSGSAHMPHAPLELAAVVPLN